MTAHGGLGWTRSRLVFETVCDGQDASMLPIQAGIVETSIPDVCTASTCSTKGVRHTVMSTLSSKYRRK